MQYVFVQVILVFKFFESCFGLLKATLDLINAANPVQQLNPINVNLSNEKLCTGCDSTKSTRRESRLNFFSAFNSQ